MTGQQKDWLQRARQQCESAGIRLTDKREQLLRQLHDAGQPLSAYDLVARYNAHHGADMKPMSAYRMLDSLIEAKVIHRLDSNNTFVACVDEGHDCSHHGVQFLICDQCDRVVESPLSHSLLRSLDRNAADAGFHHIRHQVELHGICDNCAASA